jgi:phytanoyl-CoA hydroxylase
MPLQSSFKLVTVIVHLSPRESILFALRWSVSMRQVLSPISESFFTAEQLSEDDASFAAAQFDDALQYYKDNGYVVVRDLLAAAFCSSIKSSFDVTIKNYNGLLLRHNGKKEASVYNSSGFMMNPLMNIHQHPNKVIQKYTDRLLSLLTHEGLAGFAARLLGGAGVGLLTWNQFEGNPETEPHHDCYFWGSDLDIGKVVGAWIALEDIRPGAGRLYVYPGSHKLNLQDFANSSEYGDHPLHPGEAPYQELIVKFLKDSGMACYAPLLRPGDVLFWDARTIHGSLATITPEYSRASLTAHYSLDKWRFFSEQSKLTKLNGVSVVYTKFSLKQFMSAKFPILRRPYQVVKSLLKH